MVNVGEGGRMCCAIVALNGAIFLLWRLPPLRPFLTRHFTHDPLSGKVYTLFTSLFSHRSFFRFGVNSVAIAGFGSVSAYYFQQRRVSFRGLSLPQTTAKWHVAAFVVISGLFGMLCAHIAAVRTRYPTFLSRLKPAAAKALTPPPYDLAPKAVPSLSGMYGAVYATLTVSVIIFPEYTVELTDSLKPTSWGFLQCAMLYALSSVLEGRSRYIHIAHLGGAAFAFLYLNYGDIIWLCASAGPAFAETTWVQLVKAVRC